MPSRKSTKVTLAGSTEPVRALRLGPAGAVIALEYPLATRIDRWSAWGLPIAMTVCGAALVVGTGPRFWLGAGLLVGAVALFVTWQRAPVSGKLVLDRDSLDMGPRGKERRILLSEIVGIGVTRLPNEKLLESFVVRHRSGGTKDAFAVALLSRDEAEELRDRIAVRTRVASLSDKRATTAAEVLHVAGDDAIGALWEDKKWRPFANLAELETRVTGHPYRTGPKGKRVPVCVTKRVWAAMKTSSRVVLAVEPLVIPD